MIKNLGELGNYQCIDESLKCIAPGRKYSTKKDSKTNQARDFFLDELNPKDVHVGDIINIGDFRKDNSYIATLDKDKKIYLMPLPDEGASGYGTIPLNVSSFFKNAIEAFKNINDIEFIHLSPKDKGLKEKFFKGHTVPQKYEYLYYVYTNELNITDPDTKKTLLIDTSGKRIGPYIKNFFKQKEMQEKRIFVSFRFNPKQKSDLQKLYLQGKDNDNFDKYDKLKYKYNKKFSSFINDKKEEIQNILIKNNIVELDDGSGGGSYHRYHYYLLNGTKKSLNKALKELATLDQISQNGVLQIKPSL